MEKEKLVSWDSGQPRQLRYRNHYRMYVVFFISTLILLLPYWSIRFIEDGIGNVVKSQGYDLTISGLYFLVFGCFYFFWLKPRLSKFVQVYSDFVRINENGKYTDLYFKDIDSITIVYWSLFYFKMKNGCKYYFSSSIERVDYIWDKVKETRKDLLNTPDHENYRLKLIQYDHHQKRKEWFFKHKFSDVINWVILPVSFILASYFVQSQNIVINYKTLYFFRLTMYALLVLLVTTFTYSLILKKFFFDKKIANQLMVEPGDKIRDLELEGMIIQRSKLFQFISCCFIFSLIIRQDINLYSMTKLKGNVTELKMKPGETIIVDNRYNCLDCQYELRTGDVVLFGKGYAGKVLAKPGDFVGEFLIGSGRGVASENIQQVPLDHLAVSSLDGLQMSFVKVDDVIGKMTN